MIPDPSRGERLLSRRRHHAVLMVLWVWVVVWTVCVIYLWTRWNELSMTLVIGASAALIVAMPDPETLFYLHDQYDKELEDGG